MTRSVRIAGFLCGAVLLFSARAEAQPAAAFECHSGQFPLGPVITSLDVGQVPISSVRYGPGLRCVNVQSVPVQFSWVRTVPIATDPFRVWGFCIDNSCYDGTFPGVIQPGGLVLIPIALVATMPGVTNVSLTIENSSGFAFTTVQLTGEAVLFDLPILNGVGFAGLALGLALAGWVALRRT